MVANVRGLIKILSEIQNAPKIATIFKTARSANKAFWAIINVADLGMDVYQLGNEMAKAIFGENYDPKLRDLCKEVAEAGIEHDKLTVGIQVGNAERQNLSESIRTLNEIFNRVEEQDKLIFDKVKALSELQDELSKSTPTTYNWFSKFEQNCNDIENKKKLEEVKDYHNPNYATVGFVGADLGIRAIVRIYQIRQKNKLSNSERSFVFERQVSSQEITERKTTSSKIKTITRKATKTVKIVAKVFHKTIGAASFGMNIYELIKEHKEREQRITELETMKNDYKEKNPRYRRLLEGCTEETTKGTTIEAAILDLAKFLGEEINDSDEDTKGALTMGLYKLHEESEKRIDDILKLIDRNYDALIKEYEDNSQKDWEHKLIKNMKDSRDKYQSLKTEYYSYKSKDDESKKKKEYEHLHSAQRKNYIDNIRHEFSSSIIEQLNLISKRLDQSINNKRAFKYLMTEAKDLVDDGKDNNTPLDKLITDKKLNRIQDRLNDTFPDRTVLLDKEQIKESLERSIAELSKPKA